MGEASVDQRLIVLKAVRAPIPSQGLSSWVISSPAWKIWGSHCSGQWPGTLRFDKFDLKSSMQCLLLRMQAPDNWHKVAKSQWALFHPEIRIVGSLWTAPFISFLCLTCLARSSLFKQLERWGWQQCMSFLNSQPRAGEHCTPCRATRRELHLGREWASGVRWPLAPARRCNGLVWIILQSGKKWTPAAKR